MNTQNKTIYILLAFILLTQAGFAHAETVNPFGNRDMSAPIDLGNAYQLPGIHAADLSFQKNGNVIEGSFNALDNEAETIGGLQYTIQVIGSNGKLYAEKAVRDQMMLGPKEKRNIPFSYTLPALPSGDYNLRIQMVSNGGRLLGWDDKAFQIQNGSSYFILVTPASVMLPEFKGQTFEPQAGPNVSPLGSVSLKATLKNVGNAQVTATPVLDIYNFDIAKGNAISAKQSAITLGAGQETSFIFPVTANKNPGVNAAVLYFTDANGSPISSLGEYQWVVRGASADILPMRISHLASAKDDQTVIHLDFVGAPDAETVKNGTLMVQIVDSKGVAAEATISNVLLTDAVSQSIVRLTLKRDIASNASIRAVITDEKGNVLTSHVIPIDKKLLKTNSLDAKSIVAPLMSIAGLLLIGLVFTLYKMKKIKFNFKKISLFSFLIIAGITVFSAHSVFAYGNGNGIEIITPVPRTFHGGLQNVITTTIFVNAPIHDAPAGTYEKNAVPLQYRLTMVVCQNRITTERVIGRYDINGGKQSTLEGVNANWQVIHDKTFQVSACPPGTPVVADGAFQCLVNQEYTGVLDLSPGLSQSICTTTLQLVAKMAVSYGSEADRLNLIAAGIPVPPINDSLARTEPSIANGYSHGMNLWLNFDCPPPIVLSCAATPSVINAGQQAVFSASASGGKGNFSYVWSGACSGSNQSCVTTVYGSGAQTATVTVTSGSQTKTTTCSVNVNQPSPSPTPTPTPNPISLTCTSNPSSISQGQQVVFNAQATGGNGNISYSWSGACYGNNQSCSTNIYGSGQYGTGSQTAIVVATSGGQSATASCQVSINQPDLNVSCYANPTTVNQGQQATFYANVSGGSGSYIYNWSGVCSGNNQTCNTTINSQGTQSENLTVTSGSQTRAVTCSVNSNTQCTYHATQKCVNNAVYWYDSCGVQQDLYQVCQSNQTCQNNTCVNNNVNVTVNLTKQVKNLSTYTGSYASSTNANPGETVQFQVTLVSPSSNQYSNNFLVKDIMPSRLTYNNNLTVSGAGSYTGDIVSGLTLSNVPAGQTVTITYQAKVDAAQSFSFGNTTLTNYVTSTSSNQYNTSTTQNASASVIVTRTQVQGATNVPTGQTNNFLTDSFFLPGVALLAALWFFREKVTTLVATIAFGKTKATDKKLEKRIQEIKSREKTI